MDSKTTTAVYGGYSPLGAWEVVVWGKGESMTNGHERLSKSISCFGALRDDVAGNVYSLCFSSRF